MKLFLDHLMAQNHQEFPQGFSLHFLLIFYLHLRFFFLIFLFAEVFNIKNFGMLDDINMPYLSLTSEENNNEYLFKL